MNFNCVIRTKLIANQFYVLMKFSWHNVNVLRKYAKIWKYSFGLQRVGGWFILDFINYKSHLKDCLWFMIIEYENGALLKIYRVDHRKLFTQIFSCKIQKNLSDWSILDPFFRFHVIDNKNNVPKIIFWIKVFSEILNNCEQITYGCFLNYVLLFIVSFFFKE